jgi:hypothetical protein
MSSVISINQIFLISKNYRLNSFSPHPLVHNRLVSSGKSAVEDIKIVTAVVAITRLLLQLGHLIQQRGVAVEFWNSGFRKKMNKLNLIHSAE